MVTKPSKFEAGFTQPRLMVDREMRMIIRNAPNINLKMRYVEEDMHENSMGISKKMHPN